MKILIFHCWSCNTKVGKPLMANGDGHIEIPLRICAKCFEEIDYEVREMSTLKDVCDDEDIVKMVPLEGCPLPNKET